MSAATREQRRDPLGCGIVLLSYLGMAGSAPLVAWADTPEAIILTLRMAFAALARGGALIITAGVLVVVFGRVETEPAP